MSTINSTISHGITVNSGTYTSPLTITSGGYVVGGIGTIAVVVASYSLNNQGRVTGGAGAAGSGGGSGGVGAIGVTITSGTVTNSGTIAGGKGGAGSSPGVGGAGGLAATISSGGTITNSGLIIGGMGGAPGASGGGGATGGAGVTIASGSLNNTGTVAGGAGATGGNSGTVGYSGGHGGTALDLISGTITNGGLITGGAGGAGGSAAAGEVQSGPGGNGGVAVVVAAGSLVNTGTIRGGSGGAGGSSPGDAGDVGGAGGAGAIGVALITGTVSNSGLITGGAGGNGGVGGLGDRAGGYGSAGVAISGGSLVNTATIVGGAGGNGSGSAAGGAGGLGVRLTAGSLTNSGTISGGAGGSAQAAGVNGAGGIGVYVSATTLINNGTILGGNAGAGAGTSASGGAGVVFKSGGTLIDSGFIAGSGSAHAVTFGSAASRLVLDPGASFNGAVVANTSFTNVLELASAASDGTLTGLGISFTGFKTETVDVGARWDLSGSNTVANGTTLTDSGGLFVTGTLSNAGTLQIDGVFYDENSLTNSGHIVGSGPSYYLGMAAYASLTNLSGGTINTHIYDSNYATATIVNLGTINVTATSTGAVALTNGVVVNGASNATAALISGNLYGIELSPSGDNGAQEFVGNYGTIDAEDVGILLGKGKGTSGTIVNGASGATAATVYGAYIGVYAEPFIFNSDTIENFGTIKGGAGGTYGGHGAINVLGNGTIINGSTGATGALITGQGVGARIVGIGAEYPITADLINFGTITAAGTAVIENTIFANGTVVTERTTYAAIGAELEGQVGNPTVVSNLSLTSGGNTLINYGHIAGTGMGARLQAGGSVVNIGTLLGSTASSHSGYGLYIGGGVVRNGSAGATGALISGAATGVVLASSYAGAPTSTTLTNFGIIRGALGIGVYGTYASNQTIIDSGTIIGTGGTAIALGAGNDLVEFTPGNAYIQGAVDGGGGTNTLEFASAASIGTLTGLGASFTNFGTGTVDKGANWVLAGSVTLGAGVTLINSGTLTDSGTLSNAGLLSGAAGKNGSAAAGGAGNNGIRLSSGSLNNTGTLAGGAGGNGGTGGVNGYQGGQGGTALNLVSGTISNSGLIAGGTGGAGGTGNVQFGSSGNGGVAVAVAAGSLLNTGTINGGSGGRVLPGAPTIGGAGGAGGVGVMLTTGTISNSGLITGGAGASGGAGSPDGGTGGSGGAGVTIAGGGLDNTGTIVGGAGAKGNGSNAAGGVGGIGVRLSAGSLTNNGTITGGAGAAGNGGANGHGGIGVYLSVTTLTNNGTISGGNGGVRAGVTAAGGAGVSFKSGGTLIDSGFIAGGDNGRANAVTFGAAASRLVLDPNASFYGSVVANASFTNVLEFTSAASIGTLTGFGTAFVNFSQGTVDAGARWVLAGSNTFGSGLTLTNSGTLTDSGSLSNAGLLAGGAGTNGGAAGGVGSNGITLSSGSLNNTGTVAGGAGGAGGRGNGYGGGHGGTAVKLTSGTISNSGLIAGGAGGAGGPAGGGAIFSGGGGNGGIAVTIAAGSLLNTGTITGGSGGAGGSGDVGGSGGNGVVGVALTTGLISNSGLIVGGAGANGGGGYAGDSGAGGYGSAGVSMVGGSLVNTATIVGGAGGNGSATGAAGGAGGIGVRLAAGSLTNSGTISGGTGGSGGASGANGHGGIGVYVSVTTLTNTGSILGGIGSGATAAGGAGVFFKSGGTLIDSGFIAGGDSSNAVTFAGGNNNLLVLEHGYAFTGAITAAGSGNAVELLGSATATVTATYNSLGLSGFPTVEFAPGAANYATLAITNNTALPGTIAGFIGMHDTVNLTALSDASDDATTSFNTLTNVLTVTGDNGSVALQLDAEDYTGVRWKANNDGANGTDVTRLCFCAGTGIATPTGDVVVERLSVGDLVLTLDGRALPIKWIGIGRSLLPHGRRTGATPVIVRAGALDDGVPQRDLHLTKGHSLYLEGMLIPVENLINHRSILWDDEARSVVVYHIELATHEVLLANGVPAESYRDDGNRVQFQNVNADWDVAPVAEPFAPIVTDGPVVAALWQRLLRRATQCAPIEMTEESDLHLLVDGARVAPSMARHGIHAFEIHAGVTKVAIASLSAIPSELGVNNDHRRLGVAVRRIVLHQPGLKLEIDAESAALEAGFQPYEAAGGFRWTDGAGMIPASLLKMFAPDEPVTAEVYVVGTAHYRAPARQRRSTQTVATTDARHARVA